MVVNYLSLFSGIEAATVAWHSLGWNPVAFSEIEKEPSRLLEHYYPEVPNLGDVTKITETSIKKLGPIDLVVFGSPCQGLSVSGKQKGLDDERSGLFTTAIKIIKWCRKHHTTRFALWENVPGAFSTNKGADFSEVIRLLTGSAYEQRKWQNCGICYGKESLLEWATLDAQNFGVPQRRRRVFALADFGDWTGRQLVLSQPSRLLRDIETGRASGEDFARETSGSPFDMRGFGDYGHGETSSTLKARDGKDATDLIVAHGSQDPIGNTKNVIGYIDSENNAILPDGVMGPLLAGSPSGGGRPLPAVVNTKNVIALAGNTIGRKPENGGNGTGFDDTGSCYTLTTADRHGVTTDQGVRRLTPLECERLQGFPDKYTLLNSTDKPMSNYQRYQALGNSMAVPVMRWIGEGIDDELHRLHHKEHNTMLFQGTDYNQYFDALVNQVNNQPNDIRINVFTELSKNVIYGFLDPTRAVIHPQGRSGLIPMSPSSADTMDTCPRKFDAAYLGTHIAKTPFVQNVHGIKGDIMHKACEWFLKKKNPSFELVLSEALKHRAQDLERVGEAAFTFPPQTAQWMEQELNAAMLQHSEAEWLVEQRLAYNPHTQSDTWSGRLYGLKVDWGIRNTAQGKFTYVDFKTGKVYPKPFQLELGAYCVFAADPNINLFVGELWFCSHQQKVTYYYLRNMPIALCITHKNGVQQVEAVKLEFFNRVPAYWAEQNGGLFNPRSNYLCNGWCDVIDCEHNEDYVPEALR